MRLLLDMDLQTTMSIFGTQEPLIRFKHFKDTQTEYFTWL